KQLPNAIVADTMGPMYSGSAVVDENNTSGLQTGVNPPLILIYTAAGGRTDATKGHLFTQCIAYSNDDGKTFTKYEKNPVLLHVAAGNRDPEVIWHEPTRRWIMVLCLVCNEFGLFSSPDLKEWKQLQTITIPGGDECPDFFPLPLDADYSN